MPPMFIALDTETGGLDPEKHSLLSLAVIITDKDYNILGELNLKLKPNDDIFHCTGKALAINKIDLSEHYLKAVSYEQGSILLLNFLKEWQTSHWITAKGEKLIPVGKNVSFDLSQIFGKLISKADWEQFVSYRALDVSAVFLFMQQLGKLENLNGSLESLANHYSIKGKFHDALDDIKMTLQILKCMQSELLNESDLLNEYRKRSL